MKPTCVIVAVLSILLAAALPAETAKELRIIGHINVYDRSAGDQAWAAFALSRGGVAAGGLHVTLNGTRLEERAGEYNYQGMVPLPDVAIGGEFRVEVHERGVGLPPGRVPPALAVATATLPGVIRIAAPDFAPPGHGPAEPVVAFSWKFQGRMSAPVDVMIYEKPGDRMVFESRGYALSRIEVGRSLLRAGKAYLFQLLKPLGEFRFAGEGIARGSSLGLRYFSELEIAPRLR